MPKDDKKKDDKKTVLEKWLKKNRSEFSQADIDDVKNAKDISDKLKRMHEEKLCAKRDKK